MEHVVEQRCVPRCPLISYHLLKEKTPSDTFLTATQLERETWDFVWPSKTRQKGPTQCQTPRERRIWPAKNVVENVVVLAGPSSFCSCLTLCGRWSVCDLVVETSSFQSLTVDHG